LAEQGNRAAQTVRRFLEDPDKFISACQLGITLATLGLGFVGETTFAAQIAAFFLKMGVDSGWEKQVISISQALVFIGVFVTVAYCQTVFGELLPKMITYQRAEQVTLQLAPLMDFWSWIANPFIFILNTSTDLLLRAMRIEEPSRRHFVHTEEELKMLVSASHEEGVLEPEEEEMLHSVFDFSDTVASEIMTPRTEMVCISAEATVKDFVERALEHGHSRLPIFEIDMDNIFGMIHIRDGLRALMEHKESAPVRECSRKVLIVPENKNAGDLLTEIKKTKTIMAIVVDEYGGTRGMVTLEDLLEELVGDIADEHEEVEEYIKENDDGSFTVDARMTLDDANDSFGLNIKDDEFNTIGGHVFGQIGSEPKAGDEVMAGNYILRVEEWDRHRIIKLRLIKLSTAPADGDGKNDGNGTRKSHETNGAHKDPQKSVEAG